MRGNAKLKTLASSGITVRDRHFFVAPSMTVSLLKAAPDAQLRLMIALWGLTELRKMEFHNLTWGKALKDRGQFGVRAAKTAHTDGKEIR